MTECKGEVGAVGAVYFDTQSPAPDLWTMEGILNVMRGCAAIYTGEVIHMSINFKIMFFVSSV